MSLFSTTEYAAITIGSDGTLRGARLRRSHKRLSVNRVFKLLPDDRELTERFGDAIKKLELKSEHILIISSPLAGGFFFTARTPELAVRELASTLEFDAQQQVLQLPRDFRLQFVSKPATEAELEVSVYGFPAGALQNLCRILTIWKRRADAFIYPLLALPELPPEEKTLLPELDPAFYWQDGSWRPTSVPDHTLYNENLLKLIKEEIIFEPEVKEKSNYEDFITVLALLRYGANNEFRQQPGLAVLPAALRPQRLRSLIRTAIILALIIVGSLGFSGIKYLIKFRNEYQQLQQQTASQLKRTETTRRALRAKEKEHKEMIRINELNIGDHELLFNLARLSEALPRQALVTNMRWNESGVDLTIQTSQQNLDMAASLRRLTNFRVGTLQNRQMSETIMMISLKLNRVDKGK